jgi:hypothetical protein
MCMRARARAWMRVLGWSVSDPSHAEVTGSNSAQGMNSTNSAVMSAMQSCDEAFPVQDVLPDA